jgi:hypothetical protein
MKCVIIDKEENGLYSIYEESGQCLEPDFETYEEAELFCADNVWIVVESFNL